MNHEIFPSLSLTLCSLKDLCFWTSSSCSLRLSNSSLSLLANYPTTNQPFYSSTTISSLSFLPFLEFLPSLSPSPQTFQSLFVVSFLEHSIYQINISSKIKIKHLFFSISIIWELGSSSSLEEEVLIIVVSLVVGWLEETIRNDSLITTTNHFNLNTLSHPNCFLFCLWDTKSKYCLISSSLQLEGGGRSTSAPLSTRFKQSKQKTQKNNLSLNHPPASLIELNYPTAGLQTLFLVLQLVVTIY